MPEPGPTYSGCEMMTINLRGLLRLERLLGQRTAGLQRVGLGLSTISASACKTGGSAEDMNLVPQQGEIDALYHGVRASLAADRCAIARVRVEFDVDHHLGCQRFELAL